MPSFALPRLLQLVSPLLPVGGYSYSQGLETAIDAGWVTTEDELGAWLHGRMEQTLMRLELPLLARLYHAWGQQDRAALEYWSRFAAASRESSELLAEDRHMGGALARLLVDLGIDEANDWVVAPQRGWTVLFALATVQWQVPLIEAAEGYLWSWAENQVAAGIKLVPLGQTAGQRLLWQLGAQIPSTVTTALALNDDELGATTVGVSLASIAHETQRVRLFRS